MEESERSRDSLRVHEIVNTTMLHFGTLGNQIEDSRNESGLSTSSFNLSLLQSPSASDQANAHDVIPSHYLQDFLAKRTESDWVGAEAIARPMEDTSWACLG